MNTRPLVVITSILGLLCGYISWIVCKYGCGHSQTLVTNMFIVLQSGLMGFRIGISSLGLVLGDAWIGFRGYVWICFRHRDLSFR
jgi:uncharacterized membrane protein